MILFLEDLTYNTLPDGTKSGLSQIYCSFVETLNEEVLVNPPELDGLSDFENSIPIDRIMWAHGSDYNIDRFVFLEQGINITKESVSYSPWRPKLNESRC